MTSRYGNNPTKPKRRKQYAIAARRPPRLLFVVKLGVTYFLDVSVL